MTLHACLCKVSCSDLVWLLSYIHVLKSKKKTMKKNLENSPPLSQAYYNWLIFCSEMCFDDINLIVNMAHFHVLVDHSDC